MERKFAGHIPGLVHTVTPEQLAAEEAASLEAERQARAADVARTADMLAMLRRIRADIDTVRGMTDEYTRPHKTDDMQAAIVTAADILMESRELHEHLMSWHLKNKEDYYVAHN